MFGMLEAIHFYLGKPQPDGSHEVSMTWESTPNRFCKPKEASMVQLTAVVEKGLADEPENRHRKMAVLIVGLLVKAFPCPEGDE